MGPSSRFKSAEIRVICGQFFDGPGRRAESPLMRTLWRRFSLWIVLFLLGPARPLFAQGPITLSVDASEATRKILHAREIIPVQPGPLTLLYPKWIPGEHAPNGPINSLVNLHFNVGGQPIPWQRDPLDNYTFHCDIPAGADKLEVTLDDVLPVSGGVYSSGLSATAQLALINWNQLLLYPAGIPSDQLTYHAQLQLPAGWQYGTALPCHLETRTSALFEPVSLTTLVDSPVVAGAHYRRIPLKDDAPSNVMDLVADSAAALALPDEEIAHYKQLVAEAANLYGATHYKHYHFLVGLSEHIFHSGIEHHESSLNTLPERTFIDKDLREGESDLLPHEFTHSWNGKYRRPASLTTPDFQAPMQDDMLWVYEGMTQYLGSFVLTARSGLANAEWSHEWLASVAAMLDHRAGRNWRNLQDTATAAAALYDSPHEWREQRRGVDFYPEGALVWLEADTIIRQTTNGQHSMDDFCHAFHGGTSGPPAVVTYTFDDVVAGLNAVAPYDWRGFLRTRLDAVSPHAPLGGIENSGWHLVYNEHSNKVDAQREDQSKGVDLRFSLGLGLKEDGTITDVVGGTPAETAGLGSGMKLVAVNGRTWTPKLLKEALAAAKADKSLPVDLLVVVDDFYRTYSLNYHDGERYPHLERNASKPDLLEAICRAHTR